MTFRKPSFTSGNPQPPNHPILYFDFVDPVSHLVSRMVDRAGVAAAIDWRGFELRPPPQPMIDPRTADWDARQAIAASHAGRLEFAGPGPPPLIPWTRKAHELCEFARERDCLHAVRRALFRAHFVNHTDIGRIDLLAEIARGAGLDRSEARAVLDVDRYTATVLSHRESALEEQIRDVPALARSGGWLEGPQLLREIERTIEEMAAPGEEDPATGHVPGTRGDNREE